MYILTTYLESSTIWHPSCSSGTLYVHSRTLHIAMTPSMYILEPNLPDPINNVCSFSGIQISGNDFTYRSVFFCESCVEDQILRDLILRTRLCGTSCITLYGWVVNFRLTKWSGENDLYQWGTSSRRANRWGWPWNNSHDSGRAASGGALAREPLRATRRMPEPSGARRRRALARRRRAPTGSDQRKGEFW